MSPFDMTNLASASSAPGPAAAAGVDEVTRMECSTPSPKPDTSSFSWLLPPASPIKAATMTNVPQAPEFRPHASFGYGVSEPTPEAARIIWGDLSEVSARALISTHHSTSRPYRFKHRLSNELILGAKYAITSQGFVMRSKASAAVAALDSLGNDESYHHTVMMQQHLHRVQQNQERRQRMMEELPNFSWAPRHGSSAGAF